MRTKPPKPTPDPREVAQAFVEASGFPLEVRVLDAFRQAGFSAFSSLVYDNPETGDVGEIDVFASADAAVSGTSFQISYVVECKRSADVPWLLLRSAPGGAAATTFIRSLTLLKSRGLGALLHGFAPDWRDRLRLTTEVAGVAYRVRAARANEDVAYKAVAGAIRAARAQVDATSRRHEEAAREGDTPPFEIARPVVVVGGPLFFCDFKASGEFTLEETDRGTLLTTSTSPRQPRSVLVDIVGVSGLAKYVAEQREVATELLAALQTPLELEAALASRARAQRQAPDGDRFA